MKIKDMGRVVTGKTPPTAHREYYDGEYMFITPNELHGDYAVTQSEKTITEAGFQSVASNSIKGTSILVGCIGWDMGNVSMCFEKCVTNQQINSITDIIPSVNPYYLYYWLKTKKDYLFSIASITRTPILSKTTFQEVDVPLIDKPKQDKIAQVLVPIDKKIENNSKINALLLQMNRSAYLHTFYNKPTNGNLGDIIVEYPKSDIQVGEAKDIDGQWPFFTSGDAILSWPEFIVSGRNCFLNTGGNAGLKFYVGKAAYSTDTWCISAKDNLSDYLYLLLDSISDELDQKFFLGTGLKHLQKASLKDRRIYIPSDDELESFNTSIMPWLTLISENTKESLALAKVRDWLLPMLINGQLEIDA